MVNIGTRNNTGFSAELPQKSRNFPHELHGWKLTLLGRYASETAGPTGHAERTGHGLVALFTGINRAPTVSWFDIPVLAHRGERVRTFS
jgi:hypothetical protein